MDKLQDKINKHKKLLDIFIVLRIIFLVFIVACLVADLYGASRIIIYRVKDFTVQYKGGIYADYTRETPLVFTSGILFLLSCGLYILDKNLVNKSIAYSNFSNACSDLLFKISIIGTLVAMAWHSYMPVVWPIIIIAIVIVNLNISKKTIEQNLSIKPNKVSNFATLFQMICIVWILFIFNSTEFNDHKIMWWVVQNLFSYVMLILSIISCAMNGNSYLKALESKKYVEQNEWTNNK